MTDDPNRQTTIDQEHLKLLSLFYWVSAALSAFYSLIGLVYAFFGVFVSEMIANAPRNTTGPNNPPPAFIGWIFGGIGLAIFLFLVCVAALKLRAGFCIRDRKSRTLCLVAAAVSCLEIPYGTMLGVFTFVVLDRPSVKAEFSKPAIR